MLEIERKFLIDKFPENIPLLYSAKVQQGYISADPTVRIRSVEASDGNIRYELCFKGEGTLVRDEVELDIDADSFEQLKRMLKAPLIFKDYRVYDLNGKKLECNHVDPRDETGFLYAEIEFDSVESAKAFIPPDFLGKDVTEVPGHTMADYWKQKLQWVLRK